MCRDLRLQLANLRLSLLYLFLQSSCLRCVGVKRGLLIRQFRFKCTFALFFRLDFRSLISNLRFEICDFCLELRPHFLHFIRLSRLTFGLEGLDLCLTLRDFLLELDLLFLHPLCLILLQGDLDLEIGHFCFH